MPLITSATVSLPLIDGDALSPEQLRAAHALVQAEIDPAHTDEVHPALLSQRQPRFSDLVESEHSRLAVGEAKVGGLDLSRYELLDPPEGDGLAAWSLTLQRAYASAQYLKSREVNLALLEAYGKNAWLIGNSRLEDELHTLEKDVEAQRIEAERVEQARRDQQSSIAEEMKVLEDTWRTGVGRMIETQAATEGLRQEILERKRHQAAS